VLTAPPPLTDFYPFNFSYSITLREWFILAYADFLHADPGLWRVTIDYLSYCGDQGYGRMREIVLHVPIIVDLTASGPKPKKGKDKEAVLEEASDEAAMVAATAEVPRPEPAKFDDVLRACRDYGLDEEARSICRVRSLSLSLRSTENGC
jgi:nuclear pore complex protein Nup85